MSNPRDPEGLLPDADESGGPDAAATDAVSMPDDPVTPAPDSMLGDDAPAPADDPALRGRTDLDRFGSDPDVRFPGEAEDPTVSTADATANASHPGDATR